MPGVHDAETDSADDGGTGDVMEFEASGQDAEPEGELPAGIRNLPGLDTEEALRHTDGSAALLKEILRDVAENGSETAKELRQSAEAKDYGRYRIAAHSAKGMMASIGAMDMSGEARHHEFAARDGDYAFADRHYTAFAKAYEAFCEVIPEALKADG